MSLAKNIEANAPKTSWWAESPERFYDRAREEFSTRMVKMTSKVQSFEQPALRGRMTEPKRERVE
ncbi:hypothetical protein UFOVP509_26 [uncultured Caudovirales phage]|uniref:Uncharacterized protein n=1 Tax=uncultured Caudovirales phage TaxID=2100421 RepID=A0A6J5MP10_9CAUD|nr:hypothetical protein UFOVP509_26 [uncultured Caudovirales phage]